MSLSTIFLAAFLILYAIGALGWVAVSGILLGIVALIAGILLIVEAYRPIPLFTRRD